MSKKGLEEWLARNQTYLPQTAGGDSGVVEEIFISNILCGHGGLDPSQANRMKCINEVSVESATGGGKLHHVTRVPTRKLWLPGASLRHYATLATSARFASHKHIKVRNLRPIERLRDSIPVLPRKAISARASSLGLYF